MDDPKNFTDLIQVLKTLPATEGAMLVNAYRAKGRPPWGPLDDRWYGMGGYQTASGVDVNEKTALKFSPFFCGVRKISETVASLPRHIYRQTERGKKKATDHYLYPILHHRPNPEMTSMQLWEAGMAHLLCWGNLYFHTNPTIGGRPSALWPLDPSRMEVKRPDPKGLLVYKYTMTDSGQIVNFPPWEILHVAGLGFNGLMGYNVVELAREGIATGLAYQEYSSRFFSNNATPAGFLEVPGIVEAEERKKIREDWYREYGGVSKSQLIGIIGQGMKFNPVTLNARDSQFIESKQFQIDEVARWLNIPPHMLYELTRSTNNNIEEQSLEYIIYTIRPWCVRIEQAIKMKMIMEDDIFMEHRMEGLLRGSTEVRTAYFTAGIQNGWLSINDVRELENMEWVEGGDEHRQQMQMQSIKQASEGTNGKDKELEAFMVEYMKNKKKKAQTQPEI